MRKYKKHKNVEKALVLLCVRSKMLKDHWFYKQRGLKTKKSQKTIGFTMKNFKKEQKPL